ncbi:hypothetical protein V1524DRAFT_58135 [Lipomyces starkeyi]
MASSTHLACDLACDQCWSRKVKCDRLLPCPRCRRLSLECTYNRPRKRKGPSGTRIGAIRLQLSNASEEIVDITRAPMIAGIIEKCPLPLTISPSSLCCLFPTNIATLSGTTQAGITADSALRQSGLPAYLLSEIPANSESALFNVDDSNIATLSGTTQAGITADSALRQSGLPAYLLSEIPANSESAMFNVDDSIDIAMMESLVHCYTRRMQKYYPLMDTASLLARLQARENTQNLEFGALILSICAFVLLLPVFKLDEVQRVRPTLRERTQLAQKLVEEVIAMRTMDLSYMEKPSVDIILTSFFLFACLENLYWPHAAWLRLREAVTLAEIMEMQSFDDGVTTFEEREKRSTLYRILAVTEHSAAVQHHYALSRNLLLQRSTIGTQYLNNVGANFGVTKLVSLFRIISVDMSDCWNEKCAAISPECGCKIFTTEYILYKHQLISEVYNENVAGVSLLSEAQVADITITQRWLQSKLWKICYSHRLLSDEGNTDVCREMTIMYAIDIARDTMRICKKFAMESLEVHGIGIIGKLYDIVSNVIMVISCYPSFMKVRTESSKAVPSDIEVLNQFVALLATFGDGQHPYLVPLMSAVVGLPPLC